MLDIFSGLRLVVKRRSISIDNAIFRCHWFFTSTLLVSFSLIITARQYVGQPIECHSVDKLPDSLLNSYCWVQSTFTVPQACNKQQGFDVPYPCIDNTRGREIKMFAYYQWVGIVLFIQGLLFHLPYYLWKVWENGLIKAITGGLRVAVLNDEERVKKKQIVVEYIHDHLGCHKRYAFKYFLCEFICLINLLVQLLGTNRFFDGQFLRYGIDVINYSSSSISGQFGYSSSSSSSSSSQQLSSSSPSISATSNSIITNNQTTIKTFPKVQTAINYNQMVDPMTFIFPRMTKCTYYDFGSSGDVQKHDALCLLPLNIINEKIYIALWFWFIILALLTLLVILYRIFAIFSEELRCKSLISRCKFSNKFDIRIICRHCDVGDWFLFYMVAENLDPLIMREIVAEIANKIRAHFDVKRQQGMFDTNSAAEVDSMYKYKHHQTILNGYRRGSLASQSQFNQSSSFESNDSYAPPYSNSRRASALSTYPTNQTPLINRIKGGAKHFCSFINRTNTSDSMTTRRQQSATTGNSNNNHYLTYRPLERNNSSSSRENSISNMNTIVEPDHLIRSAPPISQMPLNSAAPFQLSDDNNLIITRRGSLSRTDSNTSSATTETCVLEMQTISGSRPDLTLSMEQQQQQIGMVHLHRRLSSQGSANVSPTRPKLIRQRSLNQQSIRELRALNKTSQNNSLQTPNNEPFEEIQIIES